MKLKKFLKPLSANLNLVIVDIEDHNENSYNKHFPMIHRSIRTMGLAQDLRGEVSRWQFIDSCKVVHVEETEWISISQALPSKKHLAVYYRLQK